MTKFLNVVKTLILIVFLFMIVGCKNTEYKLTLDANGGLINNEEVQVIVKNSSDEDLRVELNIPSKDGYEFVGWVKNGVILANNYIDLDSDITLIAKYEIIKYSIVYDLDGGLLDNMVTEYTVDDEIELGIPEKDGYSFTGWDKGITRITKGTTGNLTFKALYSVNKYKINYELDGGSLEDSIDEYTINDEVILPTPSKENYKFMGWYDENSLKVEKISVGSIGDKTFYAKWDELAKVHNISYELNGGNFQNDAPTSYIEGDNFALSIPTREGYEFLGWYLSSGLTGLTKTEILSTDDKDIKVYAKWEKNPDVYDITYVLNGGTLKGSYETTYTEGEVVFLPSPTKEGSIFMGWYVDSRFNGEPVTKITSTDKGNKTFYALWMDAKGVFNSLIPSTIKKNLTLYSTHPDNSDIKLSWEMGNTNFISEKGVINPAHKTLETTITMKLTYNGTTSSYTGNVNIAPVTFDGLTTGSTVVGYVYSGTLSRWGSTKLEDIFTTTALNTLDVVNYGFATVDANGNLVLNNTGFTKYVDEILKLRQKGIRVLLCIGENSKNFSDMTFDTNKMNSFVKQVVAAVEQYHFDGVDIDWEFPGVSTGRDVSIDRPNYTKLIKALRQALDSAQESGGTKYLLTAAIPGTSWGSERYEMNILDNYLDYVNMMSYDLNNTEIACHHTPLHTSTAAKAYGFSIEYGVNRFVSLGFNKKQIVAGIAFYGKYYKNATALGKSATFSKNIHYTEIAKTYLKGGNYQQLWDEVAKAPYILNTVTGEYISYDNVRSVTEKCKYSKSSGIMGVMFWDYSEDTTGTLLKAIGDEMK